VTITIIIKIEPVIEMEPNFLFLLPISFVKLNNDTKINEIKNGKLIVAIVAAIVGSKLKL
jgi:hypothetical protein